MRNGKRIRGLAVRLAAVMLLLGATTGAAYEAQDRILPADGEIARGVVFDGEIVSPGTEAKALVQQRADAILGREVVLRIGEESVLEGTLGELGARIDVEAVAARLEAVGRTGTLGDQLDEAWEARHQRVAVALPVTFSPDVVVERLQDRKLAFDHQPVRARWDFAADAAVPHEDGELLDLHGAVAALQGAFSADRASEATIEVAIPIHRLAPLATTEVANTMDRSVVMSTFETRFGFVGSQVGRAQNVARAAAGIDGLVMMPGEAVSFNELVGPRSIANGFAHAGEIYKGEMRMGVGGGTCQVASTFHAAAYLGGLEVVERSPHSRPSGYIRIGLDATVAYPHVDLKMKNPFPFPVLVHAFIRDRGTLVVELMGREQPVTVAYDAATVGVKKYKRKIRVSHWLEEGRVIRKQAGRKGVTIQKIRTLKFADGTEKLEETHDHYPPTTEIYYVAPGTDESELPPLPQDS
jgi:vancomycin resistance protein YoaR